MSSIRRNAVANLIGRFSTALLWIAATPYALSRLGVEGFGIWSLFFAFNAYLTAFDLGIGNTMLRFIAAQRPSKDRAGLLRTLRWGLLAGLGLGLLWAVVIWVARSWIVHAFHVPGPLVGVALDALVVFGFGVLLLFPMQVLTASLQGFERIDLSNLALAVGVVVHVGVLCLALSTGWGLVGAAAAALAGQIVTSTMAAAFLRFQLLAVPRGERGWEPSWRELFGFSAALQLLWALIMLQTQAGRTILGLLGNLTMVADYELAFRVASALAAIPILVRDPIIPAVSRIWGSEVKSAVQSLFVSTSRWVYTVSVLIFGGLWLLASDITKIWLGSGHETVAALIRLWALAYALNLAYAPGVGIARGMGLPRFEIWSYAATLATNIGIAVALIPRFGTVGAVAAVVASYVVGLVVFAVLFHAKSDIAPLAEWLRRHLLPRGVAGVAAVAMTAGIMAWPPIIQYFPNPGWLHAIATGLVFVTLFALLFLPLGDTQRLVGAVAHMIPRGFERRAGIGVS